MVAGIVPAAYGLQSKAGLHLLGLGRTGHLFYARTIYYLCPLSLQFGDVLPDMFGHIAAAGNDKALVARASLGDKHTVLIADTHEQPLGDVVAVEACLVDVKDRLDELGSQLAHGVDGELHEQLTRVFLPHVAHGEVDQEIVVGLSPLQETLATLHVLHEVRSVAPDAVGRAHVDRRIELPSRPFVILGRIAGTVEENVVYSGTEHQVEVGLQL